ncbi:MAG: hypothetical protein JWR19_2560 [Pedosphaera sp.]|nr:hypothetical protein [Pedosphaera sp.]
MRTRYRSLALSLILTGLALLPVGVFASSHQDAPLLTFDPAANTTDVYAFVSQRDLFGTFQVTNIVTTNILGTDTFITNVFSTNVLQKYLTVALAVYPFEEPAVGPNNYRFDDNVMYVLHVCKTNAANTRSRTNDLVMGRKTISYQFRFQTQFQNSGTILQAFLGPITDVGDTNQNLIQTYSVFKVDQANGQSVNFLGTGIVPPNNQGNATPFYNQGDNGENRAKEGVGSEALLDRYTSESIATNLASGYIAFAGQRDDAFYGDVQAVFDLLKTRNPGVDSQGGFNVHTIVLNIPVEELGGDQQVVGVYATTVRRQMNILRDGINGPNIQPSGNFVQVARQGNPLFNELFVAITDKNLYSRTSPTQDRSLFAKYALNPELAVLFDTLVTGTPDPSIEQDRTDLAAIFIPDVIKVDLSTPPARLAGGGGGVSDDPGFSRLGIFGGDTLISTVQSNNINGGVISGGWPNGRRFGDDVIDIALTALVSDLRTTPPTIRGPIGDNVDHNDVPFNKVFPYAPTPNNGRNHPHHGL